MASLPHGKAYGHLPRNASAATHQPATATGHARSDSSTRWPAQSRAKITASAMASAAHAYQATLISQDSRGTNRASPNSSPARTLARRLRPCSATTSSAGPSGASGHTPAGGKAAVRASPPATAANSAQGSASTGSAGRPRWGRGRGSAGTGPAWAGAAVGSPAGVPSGPVSTITSSACRVAAATTLRVAARSVVLLSPAAPVACTGICRGKGFAVSRRGWVLFALMSVIWGVPYLLIKVADTGVSVPVLVFARVAVGAAVLLPIAIWRGQIRVLARRWWWLAVFAIMGLVLAKVTGGPERLTAVRWAGLLAGLGGVALLAGPHLAGGSAWPITEVILVAVCYATGPLVANRKLGDLPGLSVTAICLAAAAVVYAPVAALTWPSTVPSARVLGSLAGLGVLCTAIAFVLFFQLIAEVGPARATVITYVNPAVAVALGVSVLGEPLTPAIVAAFVLILAGSVLATRSSQPRPQATPRKPARDRALVITRPRQGAEITRLRQDPES